VREDGDDSYDSDAFVATVTEPKTNRRWLASIQAMVTNAAKYRRESKQTVVNLKYRPALPDTAATSPSMAMSMAVSVAMSMAVSMAVSMAMSMAVSMAM
jgi:hypothetical protein